jgi:hypothetical protein
MEAKPVEYEFDYSVCFFLLGVVFKVSLIVKTNK